MRYRILIVEDEPAIADNIVYALETEGFQHRWCSTGREGLDALESGAGSGSGFDLAVLDVGLPDIGGFELCKEIRKRHSLPILFLTARAGEIDRVVGLEIGADDYMVKPFSPRELVARIKAILRRTSPGTDPAPFTDIAKPDIATTPAGSAHAVPVEAGKGNALPPFHLDADRCRIDYFGNPLELSRTEFRLLGAFLDKPGRVWSREQLMAKAWDSPESSLDRTVDAHVKTLRAKLKDVRPDVDPIRTHRGLGYSLKEDW
jgi:two-component system, OmpR family, catabolic regulation response regulator CreB